MGEVTSQSRVDNRMIVQTRVHARKDWEPVKEFYGIFATSPALRRVRPTERHSDSIVLNTTYHMRIVVEESY